MTTPSKFFKGTTQSWWSESKSRLINVEMLDPNHLENIIKMIRWKAAKELGYVDGSSWSFNYEALSQDQKRSVNYWLKAACPTYDALMAETNRRAIGVVPGPPSRFRVYDEVTKWPLPSSQEHVEIEGVQRRLIDHIKADNERHNKDYEFVRALDHLVADLRTRLDTIEAEASRLPAENRLDKKVEAQAAQIRKLFSLNWESVSRASSLTDAEARIAAIEDSFKGLITLVNEQNKKIWKALLVLQAKDPKKPSRRKK